MAEKQLDGSGGWIIADITEEQVKNADLGVGKFFIAKVEKLDLEKMTATKVWEFIHPDSFFSPSISSVQRLENGNTLINFGNLSLI